MPPPSVLLHLVSLGTPCVYKSRHWKGKYCWSDIATCESGVEWVPLGLDRHRAGLQLGKEREYAENKWIRNILNNITELNVRAFNNKL